MNKKVFYVFSTIALFALGFFYFTVLAVKEDANFFIFCPKEIEYFGDKYRVVKIGDRCWMAENLKTIQYRDGSKISRLDFDIEWENAVIGAYSVYPNSSQIFVKDDSIEGGCRIALTGDQDMTEVTDIVCQEEEMIKTFGILYNFDAVNSVDNTGGICPEGWSVPSHEDWTALERVVCTSLTCGKDFPFDITTVGHRGSNEGSKLSGFSDMWYEDFLTSDENFASSGFDALPAGYRDTLGPFVAQGFSAYFWSVADKDGGTWIREIHNNQKTITRQYFQTFGGGMSVRCIKDN